MPSTSVVDTTSRPIKGLPCRKRRKVIHEKWGSGGSSIIDGDVSNENENEDASSGLVVAKGRKLQTGHEGPSICVSCHRGLVTLIMECAICHSSSCVICARHCMAPTTATSSTPSTTRIGNSPLTPSDTNAGGNNRDVVRAGTATTPHSSSRHRRRKLESGEAEPDREEEQQSSSSSLSNGVGCGRTVCRRCCVENSVSHGYTCLDCVQGKRVDDDMTGTLFTSF